MRKRTARYRTIVAIGFLVIALVVGCSNTGNDGGFTFGRMVGAVLFDPETGGEGPWEMDLYLYGPGISYSPGDSFPSGKGDDIYLELVSTAEGDLDLGTYPFGATTGLRRNDCGIVHRRAGNRLAERYPTNS